MIGMLHVWLVNDISGLVLRIQFHLVQWNQFIVLTCIVYFTLSIRLVIICLWCYTCDCDATLVIVMQHVWFWGYTCDCEATRVIVMQHLWLWCNTCDFEATRVIVMLHLWLWCNTCDCDATLVIVMQHVWFWGYTCDCEATRVIVWSVVSGFKTVFWIPTNYNTYSYIRYSGLTGSLSSISLLKNERKRN